MRNSSLPAEVALMLCVVLLSFAVFAAAPRIDLWVSAQFYSPATGFVLQGQAWAELLRSVLWNTAIAMAVLALACSLAVWWRKRTFLGVPTRLWLFIVVLYVTVPGLLVNGILKRDWGRARPASIDQFGGDAVYTLPHQITDQCASNCSFVSGEVSGVTALCIACLLLLRFFRLSPVWHRALQGVIVTLPLISAVQRIGSGRHFLSDTLFAILFTVICARLIWRAVKPTQS